MKILAFLFIMLVSMSAVFGVGIKYVTEGTTIDENSEKCLTYYVYNPTTKDIQVKVGVSQGLKDAIIGQTFENRLVKAGTDVGAAESVNFCFKVPTIYQPDCLIGNMLCEQKCLAEKKTYEGEVVMSEVPIEGAGGSGSGVMASAAAPLKLVVNCVPYERNFGPLYITGIVIVLVIIVIILYKEFSAPVLIRDEEKLKRLQQKVAKEKEKK